MWRRMISRLSGSKGKSSVSEWSATDRLASTVSTPTSLDIEAKKPPGNAPEKDLLASPRPEPQPTQLLRQDINLEKDASQVVDDADRHSLDADVIGIRVDKSCQTSPAPSPKAPPLASRPMQTAPLTRLQTRDCGVQTVVLKDAAPVTQVFYYQYPCPHQACSSYPCDMPGRPEACPSSIPTPRDRHTNSWSHHQSYPASDIRPSHPDTRYSRRVPPPLWDEDELDRYEDEDEEYSPNCAGIHMRREPGQDKRASGDAERPKRLCLRRQCPPSHSILSSPTDESLEREFFQSRHAHSQPHRCQCTTFLNPEGQGQYRHHCQGKPKGKSQLFQSLPAEPNVCPLDQCDECGWGYLPGEVCN